MKNISQMKPHIFGQRLYLDFKGVRSFFYLCHTV